MPAITIPKKTILDSLSISQEKFERDLFDFGIELEETEIIEGVEYYKLDISANRFDLLCLEGIYNAFLAYSNEKTPAEEIQIEKSEKTLYVEDVQFRPIVQAFVLKNVAISSIPSLIEYQESLHKNLGRNRKNMSMGLHKYNEISFPISYKSSEKSKILFNPLKIGQLLGNSDEKITLESLDEKLKNDKILSKYTQNCDSACYFVDSKGLVFSYPPVLNCEETKLPNYDGKTDGKVDIFVEITGDDKKKVEDATVCLINNFGRGGVEQIVLKHDKESSKISEIEDLVNKKLEYSLTCDEIKKVLDICLSKEEIKKYLVKMMHSFREKDDLIIAQIHFVRRDILHKVDLFEDLAIAHTLEKFKKLPIPFSTVGKELFSSAIENKIRDECANCEFLEVLNLTLLSESENLLQSTESALEKLNLEEGNNSSESQIHTSDQIVSLLNPKSAEYQVVRSTLIPGLLKSIKSNSHCPLPIKIFETGDICVVKDGTSYNQKRISGVIAGQTDNLEDIIGIVNQILFKMQIKGDLDEFETEKVAQSDLKVRKCAFLGKRAGMVTHGNGDVIGVFGVLNPDVTKAFNISHVVTGFELNLDALIQIIAPKNQ